MKNKVLAVAGAAALTLSISASASYAGYAQPGETMGVSLLSPLPEGVFFADLEDYGRSHVNAALPSSNTGVGVNIPVIIWSTPFSFYNTRLEFILATPFAHFDGAGLDRVGAIDVGFGPLLAHDFGNGLTGGIGALIRSPDASANIQDLSGRTATEVDIRQSLQYKVTGGAFNGITLIENAFFTSCLCRNYGPVTTTANGATGVSVQNDLFAGDFAIEKTIGKLTVGFTGFGNIDTDNKNGLNRTLAPGGFPQGERNVALGGLINYDFGKFTLTGIVTRSVISSPVVPGVAFSAETRGWLRLVVPLYVAPTAPVVARY